MPKDIQLARRIRGERSCRDNYEGASLLFANGERIPV
ncbi:hypothetical protein AM587_10016560 [Phytophthora nicotianae]|uniref:Uncharacterized protein n=1 Tax=Phytophthora nicotianae TaxID=4792 RepID=A0A0W8BVN6_PHYNI|nr:hypothetical protein AM587_10016560 [Phytophthora nicotianae]